jgi:hypothetical protein
LGLPILLFAAALAVRAAAGFLFMGPGYLDAFYYVDVARQLAAGHGLNVPFVWAYLEVGGHVPAVPLLPVPADAHWLPLASLVQVPFIWLLGPTGLASALPFWLAGAAAAPLTYLIGLDAGLERWQALVGGALVAVPGAVTAYMAQPDNFGLYLFLGALALWLCGRGLAGDRRAFVLGGLMVGLGSLARNDGILLGVPFGLAFLVERWGAWRGGGGVFSGGRIGWSAAIGCLAAFAVVMVPWYLRQIAVFGTPLPSAATGRILWITSYDQLFSVTGTPTVGTFLAQGLGPLLASRLLGLVAAIGLFAYQPFAVVLAPFAVVGAWLRRRSPSLGPWFVYGITLLAFSSLLFALHVPSGNFMHSAVALLPVAYLLLPVGIAAAVGWVARRRTDWDVPRASRTFSAIAVAVVAVFAAATTVITSGVFQGVADARAPIALALQGLPAADRLMSADPAGWWYTTGRSGVMSPADPLPVVEQAAAAYDVRWLVLERSQIVPSLEPVLDGTAHPGWLSAPLVTSSDGGQVAAALYAVCLTPGDARCGP